MTPSEARTAPAEELAPGIRHFSVRSAWFYEEDSRLDAQRYANGAAEIIDHLRELGYPLDNVGDICGTIWHPVQNQARTNFKRIYTDPEHGVPFASSRSMFGFPLAPDKYLSRRMPKLPELMVPRDWLVVSRSGTVGNVLYINDVLAECAISDHAIRVEPRGIASGYLYAYLASRYGQPLIGKNTFGATVDELEPKHLAAIPVPRLGDVFEQEIDASIKEAYAIRDRANLAVREAESELYKILDIEPFEEDDVDYYRRRAGGPRAFTTPSQEIGQRLDASHHIPVAKSAVRKLSDGRYPLGRIGDHVRRVYVPPRFARNYVAQEYGVPLLQGSQLPLIRPYGLQYISKTRTKNIEKWIIRPRWVLVTCSGTVGRVGISTETQDGWAASQHILRIIPNEDIWNPGFLALFLRTAFGQHQLKAGIYGGVVDELTEDGAASVIVPLAPLDEQRELGEAVVAAWEAKESAQTLEADAIASLEARLQDRRLKSC
jgi:type I restriction enzyme S subunit